MDQQANAVADRKLTLDALTSEWFLFLTTFRRNVESMPADDDWVRLKLKGMLDDMQQRAASDPKLQFQFQEARFPLVYVADEILLNCGWAGESNWAKNLLESNVFNTQHAGQDFYARLNDPALHDRDVLEVYFECLCGGFVGQYVRKPLQLREERDRLHKRIGGTRISGPRFCPEAYAHTDERNFVKFPAVASARIAVATVAFMVVIWLIANFAYNKSLEDLRRETDSFLDGATTKAR